MAVEVKIPTVMQKLTDGARSVEVEAATLREAIDRLEHQYPGVREQVATPDGQLHRFVNIYVNDEDVRYLQQLDTPVADGDVIQILPALAGGNA